MRTTVEGFSHWYRTLQALDVCLNSRLLIAWSLEVFGETSAGAVPSAVSNRQPHLDLNSFGNLHCDFGFEV
jgi:hypothetical protein